MLGFLESPKRTRFSSDEESYFWGHLSKCKHCGSYIEKRSGHQVCRSGDYSFGECWYNRHVEKMTDEQFRKYTQDEFKIPT